MSKIPKYLYSSAVLQELIGKDSDLNPSDCFECDSEKSCLLDTSYPFYIKETNTTVVVKAWVCTACGTPVLNEESIGKILQEINKVLGKGHELVTVKYGVILRRVIH